MSRALDGEEDHALRVRVDRLAAVGGDVARRNARAAALVAAAQNRTRVISKMTTSMMKGDGSTVLRCTGMLLQEDEMLQADLENQGCHGAVSGKPRCDVHS